MDVLVFIGRVIFGLFLLSSGVKHFTGYQGLKGFASFKKLPTPGASVVVSGLLLVFGGVTALAGWLLPYGMIAAALFLLLASVTLHNYWVETDPAGRSGQQVNFNKNLALMGAALVFAQMPLTVWWIH